MSVSTKDAYDYDDCDDYEISIWDGLCMLLFLAVLIAIQFVVDMLYSLCHLCNGKKKVEG